MKAIGIILTGGNNERLGELTSVRAASALPMGSCYRVIDFPISNMSNSGINKIAVITQYNPRSLHDHLNSSKWWDLGRKHGGLFVFTPFLSNDHKFFFRGTADSMYQNIAFLKRSNEELVVIASGDCVYKMDYQKFIMDHLNSDADISIAVKDIAGTSLNPSDFGVLKLDENNRVTEFEEKPLEPNGTLVSMGVYILSRQLLIQLLEEVMAESKYEFVNDILVRYRKKLNINAYRFDSYWAPINSVKSYYLANMDFLDHSIRSDLIHSTPYIETKPKDEPPTKFNAFTDTKNCLIGSGTILNGSAENSIFFRKVFTGEGSSVKNSIIMEGCDIGKGSVLEYVILDKDVTVSDNKHIIGTADAPVTLKKGSKE